MITVAFWMILALVGLVILMTFLFLRETLINKNLRIESAFWYNKANEKWVVPIKRKDSSYPSPCI